KEHSVATADGGLSIAFRIVSKTNTRRGIEKMTLDAASIRTAANRRCRKVSCREWATGPAALHDPIKRVRSSGRNQRTGSVESWGSRGIVLGWIEVVCLPLALPIRTEQA